MHVARFDVRPQSRPSRQVAARPAAHKERLSFECLEVELHAEACVAYGFDDDGTGDAREMRRERTAGETRPRGG